MNKRLVAVLLCLALIVGAFSFSSFALYLPGLSEMSETEVDTSFDEITSDVYETAEKTQSEEVEQQVVVSSDETHVNEEDATETAEISVAEEIDSVKLKSYGAVKSVAVSQQKVFEKDIAPGQTVSDSLSSADSIDAYIFTLTERGVLQYSLSRKKADGTTGWRVDLYQQYNSNGYDGEIKWRHINVLTTSTEKNESVSPDIGLYMGTYKICISEGSAFTTDEYTLGIDFTAGTDYEAEYNDSAARYTPIVPGISINGSACLYDSGVDADYYMFNVYSDSKIEIKFAHEKIDSVSAYWCISLTDAAGNEIYADNSFGEDTLLSSGEIGLKKGCYFIGVTNRVYTDKTYTLTVSREAVENYETELNNTVATADVLALPGSINGALSSTSNGTDRDVFEIDITQAGFASFDFSLTAGTDENYSHNVKLTDAEGNGIWESLVSPKTNSVSSGDIGLGIGKYYITVDNSSLYGNSSTYTITADFNSTSGWESEYNGSQASANTITPGEAKSGTIVNCAAEYDDDYYKFTLSATAMISLNLNHEKLDGENEIFVVSLMNSEGEAMPVEDEDGNSLFSDDGTPVSSFESKFNTENVYGNYFLPAGTYYIKVTSGLYTSNIRYNITYTVIAGG